VLKVDFGVHVKGTIVDSAFTMNFEPTWDRLLEAVKDATNTGVRVRLLSTSIRMANE
jgi:methionyl aminopeptidase